MNKKHNKKRNVLICYEALIAIITKSLINEDKKMQNVALKILKKHFSKESELLKEFKILNSIRRTTVSHPTVAASILSVAKKAIQEISIPKLENEKSKLIHDMNRSLGKDIFNENIKEYKTLATLNLLVNEWRNFSGNVSALGQYENTVIDLLLAENKEIPDVIVGSESTGMTRLITSMMMKKFNQKYSNITESQKSILRAYIFSETNADGKTISMKCNDVKQATLSEISKHEPNITNENVKAGLAKVKQQLINENIDEIDSDKLVRFLKYSQLQQELASGEENE